MYDGKKSFAVASALAFLNNISFPLSFFWFNSGPLALGDRTMPSKASEVGREGGRTMRREEGEGGKGGNERKVDGERG